MPSLRLTPRAYRAVTLVALVALAAIIVTGAAVRLTGSGLGCPDWPTCDNDRLVAPLEYHPMIEFVNRVITGIVSVAVIVAVLGSLVREPRRRDLTWLSLGLVGGVLAQIVLGGLTVLWELTPPIVMAHFLVSIVLLANAAILHRRAGEGEAGRRPVVDAEQRRLTGLLVVLAGVVLFAGTVVTGAGPHGGDEDVRRLGFDIEHVARLHGLSVALFLAVALLALYRARRTGAPAAVTRAGGRLVAAIVLNAAIGYTQYLADVPPGLVLAHIVGAIAVVLATLDLHLSGWAPQEGIASRNSSAASMKRMSFGVAK